jgi:hypothetical protein
MAGTEKERPTRETGMDLWSSSAHRAVRESEVRQVGVVAELAPSELAVSPYE